MKRKLAVREKITFVIAGAALLGGTYTMLRVKAHEADIQATIEEVKRLQDEIAAAKPVLAANQAQSVEEELAVIQKERQDMHKRVEERKQRQVDVTSSEAVQVAMLEITELAQMYQVKLKSTEASEQGIEGLGNFASGNDPLQNRPVRRISLSGQYASISQFLDALANARHEVNIMQFSLKAASKPTSTASPLLDAEVVILL